MKKNVRICEHEVITKLFWHCFVSLVSFSYCPNFMSISSLILELILFYKRLARNMKFENNPVWILLNIGRMGEASDAKFGTDDSNEMLLNVVR